MNLASIDLNLLVALDALLEERHVTRAARRAGLTQPAMSNALARLRRLLADPILIPGQKKGLVPTARAQALAGPLHRVLGEVRDALAPAPEFDPAAARREFTIVAMDYQQAVLLPPLLRRLEKEAPNVDLVMRPPLRYMDWDAVVSGEADAAILPVGDTELPRGLHRKTLFVDPLVCVVRTGHPRVGRRLTLDSYLELLHLKIGPGRVGGQSTVDKALLQLGVQRRIAVRVPYFNVAPPLLARSDLIATIPWTLARASARPFGLRVLESPLELPPAEQSVFWHARTERALDHRWLRDRLFDTASRLVPRRRPAFTT